MKKKFFLLLLTPFLISTLANAEPVDSSGIWTTKYYVDEFGLPTEDAYVSTDKMLEGTFSNTATTDSLCYLTLLLDDNVCFKLKEYGHHDVKGYQTKGEEYSITVLAPDETKTEMKGILQKGSDRIVLYEEYIPAFFDILDQNGKVSILLKHELSKYLFTIEDTTGIRDVYLNSFDLMPHHYSGTAKDLNVELETNLYYSKNRSGSKWQYSISLDIMTNLPDGIVLTANARCAMSQNGGGEQIGIGSGVISAGACKIDLSGIVGYGLYPYIRVDFGYGKQTTETGMIYGSSLEKLTGDVSDQLKASNYEIVYTIS